MDSLPEPPFFQSGEDLGLFLGRDAVTGTVVARWNGDGNNHTMDLALLSSQPLGEVVPVKFENNDFLNTGTFTAAVTGAFSVAWDGVDVTVEPASKLGITYSQDGLTQPDRVNPMTQDLGLPNAYWLPIMDSQVIMEAESFTTQTPGSGVAIDSTWVEIIQTGASGTAMQAEPNVGVNVGNTTLGPRLDYAGEFFTPGTYYVWVRLLGPSGRDDSVHVGLDGVPVSYSKYGVSNGSGEWHWEERAGGKRVVVTVSSVGVHTVNLWMREDGVIVDKLLLTTDPSYVPALADL
jgi:hypothetical protein